MNYPNHPIKADTQVPFPCWLHVIGGDWHYVRPGEVHAVDLASCDFYSESPTRPEGSPVDPIEAADAQQYWEDERPSAPVMEPKGEARLIHVLQNAAQYIWEREGDDSPLVFSVREELRKLLTARPTPPAPEGVRESALRAIEETLICHANFGRGKEMTAAVAEKIYLSALAPHLANVGAEDTELPLVQALERAERRFKLIGYKVTEEINGARCDAGANDCAEAIASYRAARKAHLGREGKK